MDLDTDEGVDEVLDRLGLTATSYGIVKPFADGTQGEVMAMTFGKGRVMRCLGMSVEGAWCYDTYVDAVVALAAWDGDGEPEGWFKNVHTGELRPENTTMPQLQPGYTPGR